MKAWVEARVHMINNSQNTHNAITHGGSLSSHAGSKMTNLWKKKNPDI